MPYRLSSLAERDLDEIWLYVAEEGSPTTADRLIVDIVDRFDLMAEQPRMGRLRPKGREASLSGRLFCRGAGRRFQLGKVRTSLSKKALHFAPYATPAKRAYCPVAC